MRPVDRRVKADLDSGLRSMEDDLSADMVAFSGRILPGHEMRLRDALDALLPCADQGSTSDVNET